MVATIVFTSIIIVLFATFVILTATDDDPVVNLLKKFAKFLGNKLAKIRIRKRRKPKWPSGDAARVAEENAVKVWVKCPSWGIGTSFCSGCTWDGHGKPPCY